MSPASQRNPCFLCPLNHDACERARPLYDLQNVIERGCYSSTQRRCRKCSAEECDGSRGLRQEAQPFHCSERGRGFVKSKPRDKQVAAACDGLDQVTVLEVDTAFR